MAEDQPSRRLAWEACYNARDLGGYATSDGGRTRWGVFVRADNLGRLSPASRIALLDYGVRTVIDLRRSGELEIDPDPFAERSGDTRWPQYANLPLGLGADRESIAAVSAAGNAPGATMEALFRLVLDRYWRGIGGVMRALAAAPQGGVLFHCHAGKDRTGLIAALLLALAGVPAATIAEDYALSQEYLRPVYDARLRAELDPARRAQLALMIGAAPGTMLSILEHLDSRHGGAERYLLAASVAPADLERLRRRVRE